MTELDPTQIIKDKDCIYFQGQKYQKVKESPKMTLGRKGEVSVVMYNKEIYYRIQYKTHVAWWKRPEFTFEGQLDLVTDGETEKLLEGIYFNDVKKGQVEEYDD